MFVEGSEILTKVEDIYFGRGISFSQFLHILMINVLLFLGLMAATLAPSVRISVTGGQEGSDSSVNEDKGLRIKNRQPTAAVTESKYICSFI